MFHGSMVALVTPMQQNEDIDYKRLQDLVEWHIAEGTQGIIVAGTTGESATLDSKEKQRVIRTVVEQVHERIPVIAGTAAQRTRDAIALTQMAMEEGVDACLIMTPAYIKPPQEGLYQHYKAIAEAVAVPQILYNVPGRTACDLLPETVERLAKIPNIIGIKEATGQIERAETIINACGAHLDVYSGDDPTALALMSVGAKGVISVTANVAPRLMHEMCLAALNDDAEEAQVLNARLQALHTALFVEANPIPSKWALSQLGLIPAGIRLPLVPLAQAHQAQVRAAMQEANIQVNNT